MKVSIIIPVYNERPTLSRVIERVVAAPLPAGCAREVIVVDDGSTDGSGPLLDRLGAGEIVVHHSAAHAGKGSALRAGIVRAAGEIVMVQDGDLEYDPRDYVRLLAPIVDGSADVVYGTRFRDRANLEGMAWPNWLANRILTVTANVLFAARITDEATAYKAFRAAVLRRIRLRCTRFEFCPEVTAKLRRLGYVIREVPISYSARSVQQGKKIRYRDGFEAFWTFLRYRCAPRASFLAAEKDTVNAAKASNAAADAQPPGSPGPGRSRAAG